jgi:hypothetical protein
MKGQAMTELKKETRGRKRMSKTVRARRNVTIDDDDWAKLEAIGGGNKSEAIHALLAFYQKHKPINTDFNAI